MSWWWAGAIGAAKHRSSRATESFSTSAVEEAFTTKPRRRNLTVLGIGSGWSDPNLGIGNDGLT